MSCTDPIYAVDLGLKENGMRNIKILPKRLGWLDNYKRFQERYGSSLLSLPCGRCLGCKLAKAKEWAVRCSLEASLYDDNCFVTLTYDDVHLPPDKKVNKKHLQDFIKRLRKVAPFRYFAVGEYGSSVKIYNGHGRPHYHLIIFGYNPWDMDPLKSSKVISSCWKFGNNYVDECNFETCQYVARYTTKKLFGQDAEPFLMMSLKPGIGASWLEAHLQVFDKGMIFGSFGQSGLPRYFEKLGLLRGLDLSSLKEERISKAMSFKIHELIQHQLEGFDQLNVYKSDLLQKQFETKKRRDL